MRAYLIVRDDYFSTKIALLAPLKLRYYQFSIHILRLQPFTGYFHRFS